MRDVLRQIKAPLIALVLGLIIFFGGNYLLFIDSGHVVLAEFKDISGLTPASDVKIGGVPAGKVTAINLTGRDTAMVVMTLKPETLPLGQNAYAQMRPVNLLGEKFVDISVGDMSKPMPYGGIIPLARTSTSIEIDEILNVLDVDTRARIGILMAEAGVAMQGRGTDFNRLLAELPPSLEQARALVAGIGQDKRELAALIEQSDRVIASMNRESPDLQQLVVEAEGALQTVAERRAALGGTLREAPAALVQARDTLGDLERTAEELRPASRAIRTHAPSVTAALRVLPAFTEDAVPALDAVERTAPELEKLSVGALPPLRRLRPTAANLREFVDRADPVLGHLAEGGVTAGLLDFMFGWARTIRQKDGLGHFFGLRQIFDDTFLRGLLGRYCEELSNDQRVDLLERAFSDNTSGLTQLLQDAGVAVAIPGAPTPEEVAQVDCEAILGPIEDAIDARPTNEFFGPGVSSSSRSSDEPEEVEQPQQSPGAAQPQPAAPPAGQAQPGVQSEAGAPRPQGPEGRPEDALLDYLLGQDEAVRP